MEEILSLFAALPQQGPGSDACTAEAISRLGIIPERPKIIDLGCGTGRTSLFLARELGGSVIAADTERLFLETLRERALSAGLSALITPVQQEMSSMAARERDADIVWAEGSLYTIGFEDGLRVARNLLKPGGRLAATELSWLAELPPQSASEFWKAAYPTMTTIPANMRKVEEAGLHLIDTFTLPPSAWWDSYYRPLEEALANSRSAALSEFGAGLSREIDLYRRCGESYGYVFYLARRPH